MENKELLLALFTFLGGFVGGVIALIGQIIISNKNKLTEKKKFRFIKVCKQFQTFCKLEDLYIEEIIELRKAQHKENKPKGVKDEFRQKVYKDSECARIEYNQSSIQELFEL